MGKRRGKIAEKRFKITLNAYEELGYKFWATRIDDMSSMNRDIACDYLISADNLLHAIEIKEISYKGEDVVHKIGFKNFEKRGQIDRIINFESLGFNHKAWHLIMFWKQSMLLSPSYLIPSRVLLEKMTINPLRHFKEQEMDSLFGEYRLKIFNSKFLSLPMLFKEN